MTALNTPSGPGKISGVKDVPQVARQRRLSGEDRVKAGQALLREYEKGRSIRQLCADTGYSIGRVRRLLEEAGVTYRARGGANRSNGT